MPVYQRLLVLKHSNLVVQLVPDLHAELTLPADTCAQRIELRILLGEDLAVVRVDLHVVEPRGRIAIARGRVWVVAVGLVEERCGGLLIGEGCGVGVLEAHGLVGRRAAGGAGAEGARLFAGRGRGGGGCVGKVGGEGRVVGMREGGGCARRGEAVELGGQVV